MKKYDTKAYLKVVRARFLTLSIAVSALGGALAFYYSQLSFTNLIPGMLAVILLHMAVNCLNAASDAERGIDRETEKTDFSGGIETIVAGEISQKRARNIGYLLIISTVPIFAYFAFLHSVKTVFSLAILSYICVIGYTDLFARKGLGEIVSGIGLGSLPVFTLFYFQSGSFSGEQVIFSALMSLPVFNLLLLNEFPDIDVDRRYGRKNIPTVFGPKIGLTVYLVTGSLFYLGIAGLIKFLRMPITLLILFTGAIILIYNSKNIYNHSYKIKEKNLRLNVLWTHAMYLLTAIVLLSSRKIFL